MNLLFTMLADVSSNGFMRPALLVLVLLLSILIVCSIFFTTLLARAHRVSNPLKFMLGMIYAVTLIVFGSTVACFARYTALHPVIMVPENKTPSTTEIPIDTTTLLENANSLFQPTFSENTDPKNWNVNWEIMLHGTVKDTFQRNETIFFGDSSQYSTVEGITTFRGDNYRTGASFGATNIVSNTLSLKWSAQMGSLNDQQGCGWSMQPLIARWDAGTKAVMNLLPEKKAKENLVEVIYAALDGHVYFYDLDDGSYTRDPINIGMGFTCSGSLDPRGYPLLYLGAGFPAGNKTPRMFIVSLIDGSILYEQSGTDIDAYHRSFAFNSAPLIAAEADTLILPCASGILYTIKLNTKYDRTNGTISVTPENTVKVRYSTNSENIVGCESSAIVVNQYLYFADMSGMFFCFDLNSMALKWAQNIGDNIIAAPVFEWDKDEQGYLYVGTKTNYVPKTTTLCKISALTGEIVWEKTVDDILSTSSNYGGVVASPILGKQGTVLENIVFFNLAHTHNSNYGTLVALDKSTGNVIWEKNDTSYSWSSPLAIYADNGNAYLVHCNISGEVHLQNAVNGEVYNYLQLGKSALTSPIIFENTIIIGTYGEHIYAINIA